MMKKNISEATEEEEEIMEGGDPFNRLPDELILFIFSKIAEAKSLCWVSMVSIRFATLVLQAKVVIMEVPTSKNPPNNQSLPQKLFNFLTKPLHRFFFNPQSSFLCTPNPNLQAVANFIGKFRSLQILFVQVPRTNSSILKWVAHFKPSGITKFVILFAEKETAVSGGRKYMELANDLFMDILMAYLGFWLMVQQNPNLTVQWGVITDPEKSGIIYLDHTQIVEMKNSEPKMSGHMKFNLWTLPFPAWYDEFKDAKIASFNTPVNGEEPKIHEALEDIRANQAPF